MRIHPDPLLPPPRRFSNEISKYPSLYPEPGAPQDHTREQDEVLRCKLWACRGKMAPEGWYFLRLRQVLTNHPSNHPVLTMFLPADGQKVVIFTRFSPSFDQIPVFGKNLVKSFHHFSPCFAQYTSGGWYFGKNQMTSFHPVLTMTRFWFLPGFFHHTQLPTSFDQVLTTLALRIIHHG